MMWFLIAYGAVLVAAACAGATGRYIPLITPIERWMRVPMLRLSKALGGDRLNAAVWGWQDRRRAERLLPLAARLETAGLSAQAQELREVARPRLVERGAGDE